MVDLPLPGDVADLHRRRPRRGPLSASTPDGTWRIDVAADVALHVLRWDGGDRTPFVLVHGLSSNARLWDGVAAELSSHRHPVLAVDQRGHGLSDKPDEGYDMTTVTDDLAEVVRASGFDRPVLVGQSWGGNVVVEFAARFPGVAGAIGCVDGGAIELADRFADWDRCVDALRPPPLAGADAGGVEGMIRAAHPDWPESGIEGALACFAHHDDGTVSPWLTMERHLLVLRGLWEHRPSRRLPLVDEPVLFVMAEDEDRDVDRAARQRGELERAVRAAPTARVEWMRGDHDLHAQHPVRLAALLRTLADRPPPPRS